VSGRRRGHTGSPWRNRRTLPPLSIAVRPPPEPVQCRCRTRTSPAPASRPCDPGRPRRRVPGASNLEYEAARMLAWGHSTASPASRSGPSCSSTSSTSGWWARESQPVRRRPEAVCRARSAGWGRRSWARRSCNHALNGLGIIVMDFWPAMTVFPSSSGTASGSCSWSSGCRAPTSSFGRSGRGSPDGAVHPLRPASSSRKRVRVGRLVPDAGVGAGPVRARPRATSRSCTSLFDPATQSAQWIIDDRWGSVLWRTVDWLLLTMVVPARLLGVRTGAPGLHPRRCPHGPDAAALPRRDRRWR